MKKAAILLFVLSLFFWKAAATGVTVSNVTVAATNTDAKYRMVKLDVTWLNSWRTYNHEKNHDAVWIFIKYRKLTGTDWHHASLNYINGTSDGHVKPTYCEINTSQDGLGVFVYRAAATANFIGTASYKGLQLRWNYGNDGLADADLVELAVFAIEMVYIPQAAFFLGDGSTDTDGGFPFQNGNTSNPFYVDSEGALTLGGSNPGNLTTRKVSISPELDDFTPSLTQTLPAGFPKGFNAFYVMKYEVSQEQYAEFLKRLPPDAASSRYPNMNGSARFTITPSFTATAPDRACNYLSWFDGAAYADWSGLRPMTELEYEKACRGPVYPVPGEYAWGNNVIRLLQSIVNDNTSSETDGDTPRANAHCCQGFYNDLDNPLNGPMRVGWTIGGSREKTGDSYFGVSDLSGNLEEYVVAVGKPEYRAFTGSHGDGNLTPSGHATNADWPGYSQADGKVAGTIKYMTRGGSVFGTATTERLRVSRRSSLFNQNETDRRYPYFGFRAVRTAP